MNICYQVTRSWYGKIQPSLRSLLEHNEVERLFIIAEDDKVDSMPGFAEIINVKDQTYFPQTGRNIGTYFSYMILIRAILPELLPVDKVLSIDADTIILDDLSGLYDTDLSGKWFGAVPEYLGKYKPFGSTYYNAGVMLYNLAQLREDNIVPEFVKVLNFSRKIYPEQDVFNEYGLKANKFVTIPLRYNEAFCTGATGNPAIVHYAGYSDWYENSRTPRHEFLERYSSPDEK